MKKSSVVIVILSIVLALNIIGNIMFLSLIECLSFDSARRLIATNYIKDNVTVEVLEPEEEIHETTPPETNFTEETNSSETQESVEEGESDTEITVKEEPEVKPLVIWDKNNIKITCMGLDMDGFYGPELKLIIENNSDENIRISFDEVAVNGFMLDPMWSELVTKGNKSVSTMYWFDSSIEDCGIDLIYTVEGIFHIYNPDTYDNIFDTPTIRIQFEELS